MCLKCSRWVVLAAVILSFGQELWPHRKYLTQPVDVTCLWLLMHACANSHLALRAAGVGQLRPTSTESLQLDDPWALSDRSLHRVQQNPDATRGKGTVSVSLPKPRRIPSTGGRASERVRCPNVMTVRAQALVTISDSTGISRPATTAHTIKWIREKRLSGVKKFNPSNNFPRPPFIPCRYHLSLCSFDSSPLHFLIVSCSSQVVASQLPRTHLFPQSSSKAVLAIIHRPSSIVHISFERRDGHLIFPSNAAATATAAPPTLLGPREAGLRYHRPKLS